MVIFPLAPDQTIAASQVQTTDSHGSTDSMTGN